MKIRNKFMQITSSDFLARNASRSKASVLAEKFLVDFKARFVDISVALRAKEERYRLLLTSLSAVPIAALSYCLYVYRYIDSLLLNELTTRIVMSALMGGCLTTLFLLSSASWKAYLSVPIASCFFLSSRLATHGVFETLMPNEYAVHLLFCTLVSLASPPIVFLLAVLLRKSARKAAQTALLGRFFQPQDINDVEAHLAELINKLDDIKEHELRDIIKDHAPKYTRMIDLLAQPKEMSSSHQSSDILATQKHQSKMDFPLLIGTRFDGSKKYVDLASSAHTLVAGVNGGGKTNFLEHFICSVLDHGSVDIMLADLLGDLFGYSTQERVAYTTQIEEVERFVCRAEKAIHERAKLFQKNRTRNLKDWVGEDKPNRLFLIIDEWTDFVENKAIVGKVEYIARKGRKYGVHALLCTQVPDALSFTKTIKTNMNNRVALRAGSQRNARCLEEKESAHIREEEKGLCLFAGERIQTPLADNSKYWDANCPVVLDSEVQVSKPVDQRSVSPQLFPAQRGVDATFLSAKKLKEMLGCDPKMKGFEEVRKRIEGQHVRGYYVRQNEDVPKSVPKIFCTKTS